MPAWFASARRDVERQRARTRKYSFFEGGSTGIGNSIGQNFLAPFAIASGASASQVGLLMSFPAFVGSVSQLLSHRVLVLYRSRVRVLSLFNFLQALAWLFPLLAALFFPHSGTVWVLVAWFAVYNFFSALNVPVLQSLLGDAVEERGVNSFFGKRNAVVGLLSFASLAGAGFLLSSFPESMVFCAFALLFAVAFATRLLSSFFIRKHADFPFSPRPEHGVSLGEFFRKTSKTGFGMFVLFIFFFMFSASISGPFFSYWALGVLGIGYGEFGLLLATASVSGILTSRYWGKLGDRFGNSRMLLFAAALLCANPVLWILGSFSLLFLFAAKALSGFAWAGIALTSVSFVYESSKPQNRTSFFAHHALFSGTGVLAGGFIGSAFLAVFPETVIGVSSISVGFAASALACALSVLFFRKRIPQGVFRRDISSPALLATVFSPEFAYEIKETMAWFAKKGVFIKKAKRD